MQEKQTKNLGMLYSKCGQLEDLKINHRGGKHITDRGTG